jgi:hypothetical protein
MAWAAAAGRMRIRPTFPATRVKVLRKLLPTSGQPGVRASSRTTAATHPKATKPSLARAVCPAHPRALKSRVLTDSATTKVCGFLACSVAAFLTTVALLLAGECSSVDVGKDCATRTTSLSKNLPSERKVVEVESTGPRTLLQMLEVCSFFLFFLVWFSDHKIVSFREVLMINNGPINFAQSWQSS